MSDDTWPAFYTLPSSPTITCQDRFGLLDADTLDVPFWSVLTAVLTAPTPSLSAFLSLLDSIAVELRGTSPPDYDTLRAVLTTYEDPFLSSWPSIARLALSMPRLFPTHQLPVLAQGNVSRVELSREQVACLVAHQFLGTMQAPAWQEGFQNFDIWFQGEQPHERAPGIYLAAVLEYFRGVASADAPLKDREWTVTYELVAGDEKSEKEGGEGGVDLGMGGWDAAMGEISLVSMSEKTSEAAFLGTNGDAVIIAANRFVGFGRSATQEEVFVGTTPEACPAVLVTPPLLSHQVLVVRGCEATVKTVGQKRQTRMAGVHGMRGSDSEISRKMWRDRTMLFMDALELDSYTDGRYADLDSANIEREFRKAMVAFGSGRYHRIHTSLWGCGAFGGDPGVKMVILWLAASIQGAALTVTYEADRGDFAHNMLAFIDRVQPLALRAPKVVELLRTADRQSLAKGAFLSWALSQI